MLPGLLWIAATLTMTGKAKVTDLYRYAVKGLDCDALEQVEITASGETFPDDRRFALLRTAAKEQWDGVDNHWLHKQNFLCAFTEPELLAGFSSTYRIVSAESNISRGLPWDAATVDAAGAAEQDTQRLLDICNRTTGETLLPPVNLATEPGRQALGEFMSAQSGQAVTCVTSSSSNNNSKQQQQHVHQFGNTGSGVKRNGDTRTVHIVNANTVRDLAAKIGVSLDPYRFRPNIVIDGPAAWSEFDWVGKELVVVQNANGKVSTLKLSVIQKTVRCDATRVDANDPTCEVLDIPKLLIQHFPQHGPYLGVYATVESPGSLDVGAELRVVDSTVRES